MGPMTGNSTPQIAVVKDTLTTGQVTGNSTPPIAVGKDTDNRTGDWE